MRYVSTRGSVPPATLSEAIAAALAADGGLYMPEQLPWVPPSSLHSFSQLSGHAAVALGPFFDEDRLAGHLRSICEEALDIPLPVTQLGTESDYLIELFHGPTAAFKDFGARFLAAALSRLRASETRPLTILVATSGDTGAAVAAAFHRQAGIRVVILFPEGRVSPRQEHQLGCFGENVSALRVAGTFDDCQRLAKAALCDAALQARAPLTSSNSISLGRLLPQIAYYSHVAVTFEREHGEALNLIVPTGNLGNATAAILAREIGMPLGEIVLATNTNDVLPRFFAGEEFAPGATIATLANAMDVGAPSNFERLRWLYGDDSRLRAAFEAEAVQDDAIRASIRDRYAQFGEIHCPHTATAIHVLARKRREGATGAWGVVATAHPSKFDAIVEPLIGRRVEVPAPLAELLARPSSSTPISSDYSELRQFLLRDAAFA